MQDQTLSLSFDWPANILLASRRYLKLQMMNEVSRVNLRPWFQNPRNASISAHGSGIIIRVFQQEYNSPFAC